MATKIEKHTRTPNGGVRYVAYFSDDAGKPIDKEQATRVEIIEFDEKDRVVGRTYGRLDREKKPAELHADEPDLSPEQEEALDADIVEK